MQRCARESPPVWPISSAKTRERKTCRCRHEVEMFSAPANSSRPSRPSSGFLCLLPPWPAFRPRDYSLQALYSPRALYTSPRLPFNGGAYMFCMLRLTSLALPSLSAALALAVQQSGTWAIRGNAPCIDCRPAQPLCRVSPIVTRPAVFVRHEARARVHTRHAPAGPLDAKVKARATRRSRELSLTAVLLHAAGLAGLASLIKPTQ